MTKIKEEVYQEYIRHQLLVQGGLYTSLVILKGSCLNCEQETNKYYKVNGEAKNLCGKCETLFVDRFDNRLGVK